MSPPTLEVRVAGVVPARDLLALNVRASGIEDPHTVLYGGTRDEAALVGLLTRLRHLGIGVIAVRRHAILDRAPNEARRVGHPSTQPQSSVTDEDPSRAAVQTAKDHRLHREVPW